MTALVVPGAWFGSLVLLVTGNRNMMTTLATSNEEDLLTREVSDEALEAAGANEVAGNFSLGACNTLQWYCSA